tara:strand:+ start:2875 stop:3522 length:648 start_codon:yes stop_codon:yes gene_type:complete
MSNRSNISLKVIKENLSIELDGEEYFYKTKVKDEDNNFTARKHFAMGVRNVFLWSEDDDFGYKIFTQAKNNRRRVYRLLWKKDWPMDPYHAVLSKEKVELLHFMYNQLYDKGYGAKSHGLVKFNDSFWGLKLERVIINSELNEELAGSLIDDEYKNNIRKVCRQLGMNEKKLDICPKNTPFCNKLNKLVHVDLDYMHVKSNRSLEAALKLGFKLQ